MPASACPLRSLLWFKSSVTTSGQRTCARAAAEGRPRVGGRRARRRPTAYLDAEMAEGTAATAQQRRVPRSLAAAHAQHTLAKRRTQLPASASPQPRRVLELRQAAKAILDRLRGLGGGEGAAAGGVRCVRRGAHPAVQIAHHLEVGAVGELLGR